MSDDNGARSEVAAGQALPELTIAVGTEPMKTMAAILQDSNPIHFDVESVRAVGLGDRVVNQGPINVGYVLNMLAAWAGGADRVRRLKVRFLANVFAGDEVVAGGQVTGVRTEPGRSGGEERLADCDVWLDVTGGDRALAGTATVDLT